MNKVSAGTAALFGATCSCGGSHSMAAMPYSGDEVASSGSGNPSDGGSDGPANGNESSTGGAIEASGALPQGTGDGAVSPPPAISAGGSTGDRFPAPGATGVCVDVPLRLAFAGPVTLSHSGKIQIFSTAAAGQPVDSIDTSAPYLTDVIGGRAFNINLPVFLDGGGSQAVVYFHHGVLKPNQSYFVTIDAGVFLSGGTPVAGISGPRDWTFTTVAAAPASSRSLVVAREGGGDFCTIQGAIDFVPTANGSPVTIAVKNGIYHEIVLVSAKDQIKVVGESVGGTVIDYANNEALQKQGALLGGQALRTLFQVENSDLFEIESITLRNSTPQGGSQAEALNVEYTDANAGRRAILYNANVLSRQDTLLLSGLVYAKGCYVEGNVDYVWGKGTAYFDTCELKTVARAGYNVMSRNDQTHMGYVFVNTKLTADPGVSGHYLGRIAAGVYPYSQVAYVNCQMGSQIAPAGWLLTDKVAADTIHLQFWEYQSSDPSGRPVDVSQRIPASRQLTAVEAAQLSSPSYVLGGWTPKP